MGFFIYVACFFSFPKAEARDIDDVRWVIERTYSRTGRPWDEVGGPYAKLRLQLLTEDFGIVDATLTTIRLTTTETIGLPPGSTGVSSREIRVIVKRVDGEWTIFHPE